MKIRRIPFLSNSFFFFFLDFIKWSTWSVIPIKNYPNVLSMKDRFKTIFQKRNETIRTKRNINPCDILLLYSRIYIYIYSISITTSMWYRVASARKFMQSSPAWMGNPREGEQENEPDSVTRRSSGNNKSRITIGNGEENPVLFSHSSLQR